jgi:leader peptidase (prepilin peptidase)/N-methyltransferase
MEPSPAFYKHLFETFAFILGAVVGSFLNVCIYRLPLGLSVNKPRRSFCPACKYQIPWFHNLPLISWSALRGKCANCGSRISFRYFGVELLTALLFLAVWFKCWSSGAWILALPYWILVSLLIVATFIDFEYFIIPDEITWGGVGAGVLLSAAIPTMMRTEIHWQGALWSVIGAAAGYFTLWGVVELGKIAFGKKKIALGTAELFTWKRDGDDAELKIGEETLRWSEVFSRKSDQLVLKCTRVEIDGRHYANIILHFYFDRMLVCGVEHKLESLAPLTGNVFEIIIPREAMGFGDVKFIAAIGAFLGWQVVFFTIAIASMIGAIVGATGILIQRRHWSAKIPFGPYLALGALIWIFAGSEIIRWYMHHFIPANAF